MKLFRFFRIKRGLKISNKFVDKLKNNKIYVDPYKNLIWKYSPNSNKWIDATDKIEWIKYDDNARLVKFKGKDKLFHVSYINLKYYENPKEIDYSLIEYNGVPQYKINKCLLFGNKYKIFYKSGRTLVANAKDIKIYKDVLKENYEVSKILNYYKDIVQRIASTEEDNFILSQFNNVKTINEESVLSLFFKGINGASTCPLRRPIISPFGTNLSQLEAVKKAFNNRISIIEGPPGTGKTQTILNLIANGVARGYKIAIASNNNSAIRNVYEKLEKYGFSFLCALLGNKENTENFFENIDIKVPNLTTGVRSKSERIGYLSNILPEYFEKENEKNKLLESRNSIELEYKHFLNEYKEFNFGKYSFKKDKITKDKIMSVLVFLKEYQHKKISIFRKFKLKRLIKVKWKFFNFSLEEQILLLQNEYFSVHINEINTKIKKINEKLNNLSFKNLMNEYIDLSLIYFKNSLNELLKDKRKETYSKSNYKIKFNKFIHDFPVVFSSTYSLAQCIKNGYLFDYLIIDESSQVNMASAILSMNVAKNLVVVGDIKQLPQIDDQGISAVNKELLNQYGIDESYSYYGQSIMSSILAVYKDSVPRTLLKEHYRCNSEIIGFCNKEFYDNQLIIYSKNDNINKPLKLIKLVAGNHARKNPNGEGGFYSEREADEIINLINKDELDDLGIITPYRIQVKTIENKLNNPSIEVSTIHKFQGREKKNIILSTVVNNLNEFVNDPHMINVAVSRAIDCFILVASDKVVKGEKGVLADLVNYIKYRTEFSMIQEGNISSVFDILYNDYANELEAYRKKHPSRDFDSENIIKNLLNEIILDDRFKHLKISMHVSLKDIFRGSFITMNDEELKFFLNPRTHADFVIYNKFSNKPYAIIEVDGVSFHEQKEKQKERDALKDSIIKKTGIRFIRLKTNESNEKERIINLLL